MKLALHNPYWDSLGGGERYTLSVGIAMVKLGWKVDLAWSNSSILKKLEKRFGVDTQGISVIPSIGRGDGYDACFWVSDGSIPLLRSSKNILHFQFPFKDVEGKSLLNKMKFFRVGAVVCNSYFTKHFIDTTYGVESTVVYPPVDVKQFSSKRKENIILYVGRFSQLTQSKHQDILIDVFKRFYDHGNKKWKLVLAGGAEVGADEYLKELKKQAEGYPISILVSPPFSQILSLYSRSKLFWSASGFGENVETHPTKVEHFGITVLEAMASGAVPLVYNAGGHKEIVDHKANGYLWNSVDDLIRYSEKLIDDTKKMNAFQKTAQESVRVYEYERFEQEIQDIITNI